MKRAHFFIFTSLGCLEADAEYEKHSPRPHKYLLENLRLTEASLAREGPVGDINYSFFDGEGKTLPEWNVFPSLGVEAVREMVRAGGKVVVAAGRYKLPSLNAALNGELFNVLITDEMAAKELLSPDSTDSPLSWRRT
jgi:DNA-binding transcriptional regulator LsrR (DeoR family)